jgi:hypothetical protein
MLLVRSYRTFAPLPVLLDSHRRYVSVALSSRSRALGVTQQSARWGARTFLRLANQSAIAAPPPPLLS